MATNGTNLVPATQPAPFRIVIIGAGIAGLTAALALRRAYPAASSGPPHGRQQQQQQQQGQAQQPVPVHMAIYEQASQLREAGASIGLNPSGLRTLDALGVEAALRDDGPGAIAFRQPSGRPMVYRHWRTGEEIGHDEGPGGGDGGRTGQEDGDAGVPPGRGMGVEVGARHRMARYHRAHLQSALVDALPGGVEVRMGMRVRGVRAGGGSHVGGGGGDGVEVAFEDGSSVSADLLIGADGIHSKVRGAFAPDHELKWTGMVAFRAAFDFSLVQHIEGLPDDAVFWVGHERTFFATRLGKNQYAIVGSYTCDPSDPNSAYHDAKWDGPGDVEFFRNLYRGWNPVVESIVAAVPYVKTYPNHAGTALASLVFADRVALLGDAAHTHGGAFAAGGSLAINDAYALALALAHVWHPPAPPPGLCERGGAGAGAAAAAGPAHPARGPDLARALRLYDETRRPLVTRLLDVVHGRAQARRWGAEKKGNRGPGVGEQEQQEGETDAELRMRIADRPDLRWLTEHDVEQEFRQVLIREMLQNS